MAPPTKSTAPRRRNRKRKRRAASSSSSSSSGSSSDESAPTPQILPKTEALPKDLSESEDSTSSAESETESELGSSQKPMGRRVSPLAELQGGSRNAPTRQRSPSVSPPPATIPPFLSTSGGLPGQTSEEEQVLKDRFRKFWMSSVVDGFRDDLEEIRKEPNMTTSRLALLIDSLGSGAEVLSSSAGLDGINEMEVVLDQNT